MKGTFDKDVRMIIREENLNQIADYQLLTPVYSWEIIEDIKPNKPIQLIMNYGVTKYQGNSEKVLIYTQENNKLKPLLAERDLENKLLKTEVMGRGNALLSAYSKTFTDMKNHWAYEIVDVIAAQHMINGYPDGTFKPDQKMTRAEFVSILVKGGRFDNKEEINNSSYKNHFEDVAEDFWAADAINIAYEKGWVEGHENKFNPNNTITRQEMITILMRIYEDVTSTSTKSMESADLTLFKDSHKISDWALEHMEKAVAMQLIQGYDNNLSPTDNATRAEAATLLYRYLRQLNKI